MWTQLITPVLPGVGTIGNCLMYVRQRYGIAAGYPTAWDGWLGAKFKHTDRNFPNVCVPVWFKYKLPASSPGHVVIWNPADKKFYSSPYNSGQKYFIFDSIEQIERVLKAGYVGWSEDVNNVRVAINKGDDMSKWNNGMTLNLLYHSVSPEVAKKAEAANFVGYFGGQDGKESNQALDEIITSPQYAFMVADAHQGGEYVKVGNIEGQDVFKKG